MTFPNKLFLRTLTGKTSSRPPFWLMRQAGRYLPEYRAVRTQAGSFLALCFDPALATEVTLQPLRRYDMDAAILFSDILVVPHALGQKLDYLDGEGPRLEPIRTTQDLLRLSQERFHQTLAPVYETIDRLKTAIPAHTALIGFAGSPWTIATYMVEGGATKEFVEVKRWAYRDPAGFSALIDLIVDATIDYLSAQIRTGVEAIQLFDSWAGVLPEPAFRRFVIEPTRRIVTALKTHNPEIPIIGFPRGAGLLYLDYVRGTGIDALALDTTVPLIWAARTLQTRLPIQGNLDPVLLVAGGSPMAEAVHEILHTLGPKPFIFNLGHGVVQSTPPEHVADLAELIKSWPH
ncbi:MAG: uroporphyrinogen decarboxylase [Azospirillaceae bacterium]|nr:uroporphyrinogen decarboxylase [Azospirillaceae bacterium]